MSRAAWIVVWISSDVTACPYYMGPETDAEGRQIHGWSAKPADAKRYRSSVAARHDPELSDYFDSGDVEVREA